MRIASTAISLLMLLALPLAGCGAEITTAELEKLRDKTCACTDKACANAFIDDLKDLRDKGGTPEDEAKARALLVEATNCAVKVDPDLPKKIKDAMK